MSAVTDTARPLPEEQTRAERQGPLKWLLARFGEQMPKGLYARALIIIIAPMVLLQSVLTFVFLERHWQTVTHRLSTGTVQNIGMLIDMYEDLSKKHDVNRLTEIAAKNLGLRVREFGITRKTGHKWVARHAESGLKGLEERSRAPKNVTCRTSTEIERLICGERRLHPTWGAKKIHQRLMVKHGVENPPVVSTIGEVLKRHGMVKERRRRGAVFKVERGSLTVPERCNHVLGVDFKGWFCTQDGERFDPLTVTDLHSRYLMRAEGLPQATTKWTLQAFRSMFRRHGIPDIIRVDNGAPFASVGPGGLSKLSVWWIGLGIEVQFSRPACPQDNGSHERMHRTMKAECCKPPSANGWAQQQRMDRWRKEFNEERPHEALGMRLPADVYQPSARRLDERIKPRLYDLGVETRRVNVAGFIGLNGGNCYVGESFGGVDVAIERDEESGILQVRYANVRLGQLDESPTARLRPPAYAARWETKPCQAGSEGI